METTPTELSALAFRGASIVKIASVTRKSGPGATTVQDNDRLAAEVPAGAAKQPSQVKLAASGDVG